MGIFSFIQSMLGPTPEQDAALAAVNQKQRGLDNSLAYFKPYANAGDAALGKYNDAIGMGDSAKAMADFQNSPDYKLNMDWAQKQGADAVNNHAQATGTYNSGATLKALQDRATNTNNTFYGNYLRQLAGQAGMGFRAAGANANIETQGRNGLADAVTNQGNVNQAASWGNGLDSSVEQMAKIAGALKGLGGGGATDSIY